MQRNCIFPGRYAPLTYYEEDEAEKQNTYKKCPADPYHWNSQ